MDNPLEERDREGSPHKDGDFREPRSDTSSTDCPTAHCHPTNSTTSNSTTSDLSDSDSTPSLPAHSESSETTIVESDALEVDRMFSVTFAEERADRRTKRARARTRRNKASSRKANSRPYRSKANHALTASQSQKHKREEASPERCHWEPHNRPHAHPQVFFRGVGYCSLSEAAFAQLLEYFVPGFDIVPGSTFQVPIGNGRSVDFCINGTLIEYHQLRLVPSRGKFGDFNSEAEFREYRRIFQRVRSNPRKRALLDSIVRQRLSGHYYRKRRSIIDESPHFRNSELIVATSREEFFELVLRRFAILSVPPSHILEGMFWQAVKQVARAQSGSVKTQRGS